MYKYEMWKTYVYIMTMYCN